MSDFLIDCVSVSDGFDEITVEDGDEHFHKDELHDDEKEDVVDVFGE